MADVIPMPQRRPERGELMTADEIAKRWGVHRDTVYRIPPTELRYVKLGPRTRRYRREDVAEYEQKRMISGS